MKEFFDVMESMERIYWYIAIAASLIFIIQTILTFVGADADTGTDADFDSNLTDAAQPFGLFSFRNLVNFFLGFGWTGALFYHTIDNRIALGLLAAFVGAVFIAIFFLVLKSMLKLAEDNSSKIENAIGKTAEVYLNIPANMGGKGKVMVSLKGSMKELAAMTNAGTILKARSVVKVIDVKENILIVEAI